MKCKKCNSTNVMVQNVSKVKTKRRGLIGWFIWLMLAVCTCGLIIIIPLLTNSKVKTKNRAMAICQNCGNTWAV